jgi:ankyrin repeat protein
MLYKARSKEIHQLPPCPLVRISAAVVEGSAHEPNRSPHEFRAWLRSLPREKATTAYCAVLADDAELVRECWPRLAPHERVAAFATAAAAGAVNVATMALQLQPNLVNSYDSAPALNTPLHYAALCDQEAVAELLLQKGADATLKNPVKTQPLHDAARAGSAGIIKRLTAQGIDIATINDFGDSVFHRLALFCDAAQAAKYSDAYDFCRDTCMKRHPEEDFAHFLNRPNNRGFTAYDIAMARGMAALARAMQQDGASHGHRWHTQPAETWTAQTVDHAEEWDAKTATLMRDTARAEAA